FTFYPENGVSNMQKLQMITTKGDNVGVCAIKGNFDDAQTGVKKIFTNDEMKKKLGDNKLAFSSANSINWGRLAPQIVYYVYSYASLLKEGTIKFGDKVNFVVPTGNFGNILAAYYAKKMGIPVNKLICASNKNNILTDFLTTGEYNRNRPFFTTLSPSMDILISSNLERLLFDLTDGDERVKNWMTDLNDKGVYTIDAETKEKINSLFCAGCCDDAETKDTIKKVFDKFGYLADPHTAVAINVYEKYVEETGDNTVSVIASTANPYKFSRGVLEAVTGKDVTETDEFVIADTLSAATNTVVPAQIKELKTADIRFTNSCEKEDMPETVLKFLGIN
ncbi:MAG: threonine synthase, partial [Clostridia bacterium]|nr:threonine synthase [Clostridia bacterium]